MYVSGRMRGMYVKDRIDAFLFLIAHCFLNLPYLHGSFIKMFPLPKYFIIEIRMTISFFLSRL